MIKQKHSNIIMAKTFTATYDQYEDRIRFVINYQDIHNRVDFMITRRFIINIIPSIDDFIYKHYTYSKSNTKTNANHPTPPNILSKPQAPSKEQRSTPTDNTDLSFLQTPNELLHKIDISFHPKTKQTTLLFSSSNQKVKAILNEVTLNQVIKMIKKAIPSFRWGISPYF